MGLSLTPAPAQTADTLRLQLPTTGGWNEGREGEVLEFSLTARGGSDDQYSFQLLGDSLPGMQLDPSGNFSWQPGYDVVNPNEPPMTVTARFAVRSASGQTATQSADLIVYNQARISDPPNQPSFFVKDDPKKLILLLKIEKVTALELDASWKDSKKASDKNIQDTFRDFNPDSDQSIQINE